LTLPLAVGRLLRLSLSVSAAADVAAGAVFGAGSWPGGGAPWLLILASLAVYHGGMALNDWADRAHDAATRPERPIPSGAIPAPLALALGLSLLLGGPLLALAAAPQAAALLAAVAALALAYDVFARGPLLGPAALALCRAGNLGAGIVLGRLSVDGDARGPLSAAVAVPVLYGGYVFCVSRLGRLEDGEDDRPLGRRPARLLACAAALLLALPVLPLAALPERVIAADGLRAFVASQRITIATLVAAAGAFGLLRLAFRLSLWSRLDVLRAMGMALRRLLCFTATVAVMSGTLAGVAVGAAILGGYPLSFGLRRVFPPS
jgi:4-hydroxybenzoate polyprenyltransferase